MIELQKFSENTDGNDYVVGDIHGCYSLFMDCLNAVGFDKEEDRVFCVGDLVDRGPESHKCLSLPYEPWFFSVRGNHELLMQDALNGGDAALWVMNGGSWAFEHDENDLRVLVNDVMEGLPLAIQVEVDGSQVGIIHADVTSGQWGKFDQTRDVWSRSRSGSDPQFTDCVEGIDSVVVGHTIMSDVVKRNNVTYIDTGAFHTGNLQVIKLKDIVR